MSNKPLRNFAFLNIIAFVIILLAGLTSAPGIVLAGDGGEPPILDTIPDTTIGSTSVPAIPDPLSETELSYMDIIIFTLTF